MRLREYAGFVPHFYDGAPAEMIDQAVEVEWSQTESGNEPEG
jgi:hypothetical protein